MAITLLQAVNKGLKRVNLISTDLASLTDSSIQGDIDVMVQAWNETLDELLTTDSFPQETKEGSITLVAGTRAYAFASDFTSLAEDERGAPVFIDETNGMTLTLYPGGFDGMRRDQLQPADYTGLPTRYCIDLDGNVRLDTAPTSAEAGRVYKYIYNKRVNLASAADTFPILDDVVDNLVPAVTQVWSRERKKQFDAGAYQGGLSRAARMVRREPVRRRYA